MDPSNISPPQSASADCDVITHLQWTLSVDWRAQLTHSAFDGTPLQLGWRDRATSWRTGQPGTERWAEALDPSQTPSWSALQTAHEAAGMNPEFRNGPASSGGRHYGWYQDLERRLIRKLDVDGTNEATPLARAIRGFLDIVHTRPFEEGNTRAACTWVVWSLAGAGIDVATLGPVLYLPKAPADDAVVDQMAHLLV